ncbi:MAG: 50S ribosomal protein L10 [Deltaproteobacteria bacterium]|nr:50S ribosomal protein L10 [Deltaproteobacteria bacterium]
MLRQQKADFVTKMKADLTKAQTVLFLDYTGLTVAEADRLRVKMRASKVSYVVVKNALMRKAVAGTSYEGANKYLKGTPTGVILGFDDPVAAARTTYEFLKTCEHVKVKGGILESKAISPSETEALSKMPSLREIQAGIVGMCLGPAGRLLSQIKSPAGKLVGAIEKKGKEEGAKA